MAALLLEPATAQDAAAMLAQACEAGTRIVPRGAGTKLHWLDDQRDQTAMSTLGLSAPLAHYAGDLVATIPAGMTLAGANRALAIAGQWLPLDPAFGDRATIGGIVSTNDSGARRHRYGAPRDLIIGIEIALTDGRVAKAGGRVVKNVAGYDLSRLLCGSHGALGLITSATFKLAPLPAASRTVVARLDNLSRASDCWQRLTAAPVTPSAIEIQAPTARLLVRFETTADAADRMAHSARTLLLAAGAEADVVSGDTEQALWRAHDDLVWSGADCVLKVSLLPTHTPLVFNALDQATASWAAIGRIALGVLLVRLEGDSLAVASTIVALRAAVISRGGHASVLEAPAAVRALLPAGPAPSAAAIMHAVKQRFDPAGVLRRVPLAS